MFQNCYCLAGFVTQLRFYEDNFIPVRKFATCQTNIESSIESINIPYYRKRQKLKISVSTKPNIEFFDNIEYRTSTSLLLYFCGAIGLIILYKQNNT